MITTVLLLILAIVILSACHKHALFSVISLSISVLSFLLAILLCSPLSAVIRNTNVYDMMLYYFEGHEYISDKSVEMVHASVETLNPDTLEAILAQTDMPLPFAQKIKKNVLSKTYKSRDLYALGDYYNATIVDVVLNIASLLILFIIFRSLLGFILDLVSYSIEGFQKFREFDNVIAAGTGLIHGIFLLCIIFLICPIIFTILPKAEEYIISTPFGNFFYKANFLLTLIPGH